MTHLFKLLENSGSLVPIVEDKKSFAGWNKYQSTPPTREELTNWISGSYKGFGLIMGYGDYQVIDIDIKNANTDQANSLFETVWSYIPNDLKLKITVQKTRNNGLHMIYRCKIPAIHEKILINPESKKTVVETIGAKNYILIEPSPNYKIVSGSFDDIHEISIDEHNSLIGYFKKMDTYSVNENEIQINPDLDIDLISKQIQTEGVKKEIQKLVNEIVSKNLNVTTDYNQWIEIGYALGNELGEDGRDYFHSLGENHPEYEINGSDQQYNSILKSIQQNDSKRRLKIRKLKQILREILKDQVNSVDENKITLDTKYILSYIMNIGFKRNLFTNNVENQEGIPVKDVDVNSIYVDLSIQGYRTSVRTINSIIGSNRIQSYNPLVEWLESVELDGNEKALDDFINCFKLKTSKPESAIALRNLLIKWLLQFPAVIYDNKTPRLVLVLIGESYIGKTEVLRRLLPNDFKKYYAESGLDREKDSDILMTENILINIDELSGITSTTKGYEKFKSLVSVENFNTRVPFGLRNECMQRKAILCGTSNNMDIIKDHSTGNTRLLPLELEFIDQEALNAIDRRQLFGFLSKLYKKKGADHLRLTPDEVKVLKNMSEDYTEINMEKDLIIRYLQPAPKEKETFKTISEIINYLSSFSTSDIKPKAISRELGKLDRTFVKDRKRLNGQNLNGYYVSFIQGDYSNDLSEVFEI